MKKANVFNSDLVFSFLGDKNVRIVDIRSVHAYSGWKERGELRRGHIKRARNLPYEWLDFSGWDDIVKSKEIYQHQKVIIYGYDKSRIDSTASLFLAKGFSDVNVFYHFVSQWCREKRYPMECLKHYRQLVPAHWLHRLIKSGRADEYENDNFTLVHCHFQNRESYLNKHIPGALELDALRLESSLTWNRRSPEDLKTVLETLGIDSNKTVILYGEQNVSKDPFEDHEKNTGLLAAFRCAMIMMYVGVKDVRIINGGLNSWIDEGFVTVSGNSAPLPVKDFGAVVPVNPEFFIDMDEAQEYLKSKGKDLVSIRSWSEYIGETSGYSYIEKKGRIPGALFSNSGSDAYHMENYRNHDQTCREYGEIKKMWCQSGIFRSGAKAFYCGTGWKASEAWFHAYLMGWTGISIFDGGWFEWSSVDTNAVETGIPDSYT